MKKIMLVEGMSCGHCEKAVKNALNGVEGVLGVEVDLGKKTVVVEGTDLMDASLKEAVEEAGYDVVEIN